MAQRNAPVGQNAQETSQEFPRHFFYIVPDVPGLDSSQSLVQGAQDELEVLFLTWRQRPNGAKYVLSELAETRQPETCT